MWFHISISPLLKALPYGAIVFIGSYTLSVFLLFMLLQSVLFACSVEMMCNLQRVDDISCSQVERINPFVMN